MVILVNGLYPLETTPSKIKLATFDIETDKKTKVEMLGFYNGVDYFKFDNFDIFLGESLKKKYYGYNIYAHYGGKFDFLFLLDKLLEYNYDFNIIDTNGRILQITVKFGNSFRGRKINFRDSYALMPKDLKTITSSFSDKIKYPKIPYDFNDSSKKFFTCLKHKKENCLECYMMYDVIGLYESIRYFEDIINNLGSNIKLTIASTSLHLFRSKYLHQFIPSINYEVISGYDINKEPIFINPEKIIRQYYVGGRSEIIKRYCEYEFYYDVNSLYPAMMRNNDFPVSNPLYVLGSSLNFDKDKGFAYAEIKYYPKNKNVIPFLPFRIRFKNSNKLIYPTGIWEGLYDLDNLRKAKKLGYEINIKYAFIFNYEPIFKEFVDDLYSYRLKSDALNIIMKFLLNSGYGKFAQKRLIKSVLRLTNNKVNLEDLIPYNDEFGLYKKEQEINANHIIPSISSRVTQLAQKELFELIEKCDYNVTYCDTDSIITPEKLSTSNKLGDIKLEYEVDKAIFLLPKTYYLSGFNVKKNEHEEVLKMKGFINNNFSYNDFEEALRNNDYSMFNYKLDKLWGFKESMNRRKKFLTFEEKKNSIKSHYDKRLIDEDNIHTIPLEINGNLIINK